MSCPNRRWEHSLKFWVALRIIARTLVDKAKIWYSHRWMAGRNHRTNQLTSLNLNSLNRRWMQASRLGRQRKKNTKSLKPCITIYLRNIKPLQRLKWKKSIHLWLEWVQVCQLKRMLESRLFHRFQHKIIANTRMLKQRPSRTRAQWTHESLDI